MAGDSSPRHCRAEGKQPREPHVTVLSVTGPPVLPGPGGRGVGGTRRESRPAPRPGSATATRHRRGKKQSGLGKVA